MTTLPATQLNTLPPLSPLTASPPLTTSPLLSLTTSLLIPQTSPPPLNHRPKATLPRVTSVIEELLQAAFVENGACDGVVARLGIVGACEFGDVACVASEGGFTAGFRLGLRWG